MLRQKGQSGSLICFLAKLRDFVHERNSDFMELTFDTLFCVNLLNQTKYTTRWWPVIFKRHPQSWDLFWDSEFGLGLVNLIYVLPPRLLS